MKEFRGLLAPAQTIKTWYRLMPGMLGKKLARRKELGGVLRKNEGFSEAFQGFRGLIIAQGCQKRVHAADLSHRVTGAQTIKTWYKHMPDMLGKKLARRKELGGALSEEKRQHREQETEASPLRNSCLLACAGSSHDSVPFYFDFVKKKHTLVFYGAGLGLLTVGLLRTCKAPLFSLRAHPPSGLTKAPLPAGGVPAPGGLQRGSDPGVCVTGMPGLPTKTVKYVKGAC